MELRTYLAIIRKYLPLLVIGGLLGLLGGYGLYASKPKAYTADVQFYVSTPVTAGENAAASSQFATGRMVSYTELLSSQEFGTRVAKAADLDLDGAKVARKIKGGSTVGSVLVKATVTDTSPSRALTIAQAVEKTFPVMVDQLDNAGRKQPLVHVSTVAPATGHAAPVSPKLKTNLALGLATGLALALAYAIARTLMRNGIRDDEELRELAGAPVVGRIPEDAAAGQPLATGRPAGARDEAVSRLRTNLTFLDAAESPKLLLFTAPAAGTGATSVAAGTAASFAETGERVVLVEGDLRSPGAAALFGTGVDASGKGLSEVLAGTAVLDQVIRPVTGVPGLDLVTAGGQAGNPAALLSSNRLPEAIAVLRQHYDRIVIDSPALLETADAAVLAGWADGVVLVVRDGQTSAKQVDQARQSLVTVNARLLGVVNNRVRAAGRQLAVRGGRR